MVNFTKYQVKEYSNNIILIVKKKDDSFLLPKFKTHSQFKRYEILNFQNFKVFFKLIFFQNECRIWQNSYLLKND